MQTYIILFRGINVGGNNVIKMKALVALLEQQGFENVGYYIQSGNIVLDSNKHPAKSIQSLFSKNFAFIPDIFVLNKAEFAQVIENNPYQEAEGKFVHFFFCKESLALNQEKVDKWQVASEEYLVKDKLFYLHAPEGIGRSKLVSNITSCLGQMSTARNLNTINKLALIINNNEA